MKLTFASRIFAGYFLIVAVASWFLVNSFVEDFKPVVRQAVEHTLVDSANILAELLTDDVAQGSVAPTTIAAMNRLKNRRLNANIWRIDKAEIALDFYVTNIDGMVIYDSQGIYEGLDYSRWRDVYLTLRGQYGARSTALDPDDPFSSVMHVAAPVKNQDDIIGVVTVYTPNISLQPFIDRTRRQAIYKGGLLLFLALLIGAGISWWLSRSVHALIRYAEKVQAGEKTVPPELGRGEFKQLASALEDMRHELEGKEYVKRYVEQLAHELKSPIAAIKGATEFLNEDTPPEVRGKFRKNIEQQSARIESTIEQMLMLTMLENKEQLETLDTISLKNWLANLVAGKQAKADIKSVELNLDTDQPDKSINADGRLLKIAIENLIDNALDFSPENETINIRTEYVGDTLVFIVRDKGPGVPDFAKQRVFERFYSLPRENGDKSTGLGLSFVSEVAKLHGGQIELVSLDLGLEARLTVNT